MEWLQAAAPTLLAPAILFFALGMAAGWLRSDLSLPAGAARTLSLYLMLAIGFKGGVEAVQAGLSVSFATAAVLGLLLSFSLPILGFLGLRLLQLERVTASATAAHYGSVSGVTFVAGTQFLEAAGVEFGGHMVAVMALMETPAIITGLLLAGAAQAEGKSRKELWREVALNGPVFLLVGAFIIGVLTGEPGMARLELFVGPIFQGILCLFLLDMGLIAARRLRHGARLKPTLVAFGVLMPLTSAVIAASIGTLSGLSVGDTAVLTMLAASASYIAAPAAMRLALPKADSGVYLTLALGVTFPFNVVIGLPLYTALAQALQ